MASPSRCHGRSAGAAPLHRGEARALRSPCIRGGGTPRSTRARMGDDGPRPRARRWPNISAARAMSIVCAGSRTSAPVRPSSRRGRRWAVAERSCRRGSAPRRSPAGRRRCPRPRGRRHRAEKREVTDEEHDGNTRRAQARSRRRRSGRRCRSPRAGEVHAARSHRRARTYPDRERGMLLPTIKIPPSGIAATTHCARAPSVSSPSASSRCTSDPARASAAANSADQAPASGCGRRSRSRAATAGHTAAGSARIHRARITRGVVPPVWCDHESFEVAVRGKVLRPGRRGRWGADLDDQIGAVRGPKRGVAEERVGKPRAESNTLGGGAKP